jgi:hypothetical protein
MDSSKIHLITARGREREGDGARERERAGARERGKEETDAAPVIRNK